MMCMKALEQENRRLRKMYVEENIKAEIVSEGNPPVNPTHCGVVAYIRLRLSYP